MLVGVKIVNFFVNTELVVEVHKKWVTSFKDYKAIK